MSAMRAERLNPKDLPKMLVILGAGANIGIAGEIADTNEVWRPPLADELFGSKLKLPGWRDIIKPYTGAINIGNRLTAERRSSGASLEQALRGYYEHDDFATRLNFRHVPPYLRDLLQAVSHSYTDWPGTLIRLCGELLAERPHHVAFVTLNYDTFIERALSNSDPPIYSFRELDNYIEDSRQAKVFKIHGSVDWAAPIGGTTEDWEFRVSELSDDLTRLRSSMDVKDNIVSPIKGWQQDNKYWYPILTAPLAGKDDDSFVCPESHENALKEFLSDCEKVLIIGNSGTDDDLMLFLNNELKNPKHVLVVDKSKIAAEGVIEKYKCGVESIKSISQPMRQKVMAFDGHAGDFMLGSDVAAFADLE